MTRYLVINIKTIFRIPLSVFFSIAYPLLMMIIMMISYGNPEIGRGYHLIDKYLLITIGMGILPLTLVSYPIWVASDIEDDSLKRMIFFKIKFKEILISEMLAHLFVALACVGIDVIFAHYIYGAKIPDAVHFIFFILQYGIAIMIYILIGTVMALLLPKRQVLMSLGLVSMFMVYMFCGAFIEYSQLPIGIQKISRVLPIKYAMNDFYDIWIGNKLFDLRYLELIVVYSVILLIMVYLVYKKKYFHWRKIKLRKS